jgi:hypothetical protein
MWPWEPLRVQELKELKPETQTNRDVSQPNTPSPELHSQGTPENTEKADTSVTGDVDSQEILH